MKVGRSSAHTPIKHALFRRLSGRDVGIASQKRNLFSGWVGIDMTAGDGSEPDDSPRIIAKHVAWALDRGFPARAELFERDEKTMTKLVENLGAQAGVNVTLGDSTKEAWQIPVPTPRDSVVLLDDPNSGGGSTLTVEYVDHLRSEGCWALTTFCAIGANASGRFRVGKEMRDAEAAHYSELVHHAMDNQRYPLMCRINNSGHRWGYLILTTRNEGICTRIVQDMTKMPNIDVADGYADVLEMIAVLYRSRAEARQIAKAGQDAFTFPSQDDT